MKNIMKTVALAAILMFAIASTSPAQKPNAEKMQNIEQRVERMKKHLNLTDDQAAKIKAILENAKSQILQNKSSITDNADRKNAMQKLRSDTRDKIKAVLTPEQQQKLEKNAARREKKQAK